MPNNDTQCLRLSEHFFVVVVLTRVMKMILSWRTGTSQNSTLYKLLVSGVQWRFHFVWAAEAANRFCYFVFFGYITKWLNHHHQFSSSSSSSAPISEHSRLSHKLTPLWTILRTHPCCVETKVMGPKGQALLYRAMSALVDLPSVANPQ